MDKKQKMTFEEIERDTPALQAIGRALETQLGLQKSKRVATAIHTQAGPKTHLGLARAVLAIIQDTAFEKLPH